MSNQYVIRPYETLTLMTKGDYIIKLPMHEIDTACLDVQGLIPYLF
jgi:hypothetical protein